MYDSTRFSRKDFDQNAKALLSAFAKSEEFEPSFELCDWELNCDEWNGLYLLHPPVTLSSSLVPSEANNHSCTALFTHRDSDGALEDEGILEDDQCYVDETANTKATRAELPQLQQNFITQWTFSIVYSTTYQSPVLYFSVQEESSGNPVGRQLLLKLLGLEHKKSAFQASNDFPTDEWEFVSQEEHPVTGLSSFFLHPCQSAQRLQFLTTAVNPEDHTSVGNELEQTTSESSKTNVLWTWMSMILPAVGHSVPSSYFRHIQECITRQS